MWRELSVGEEGRSLLSRASIGMSKQVGFLSYETADTASLSCLSVIKLVAQYDPLLEKHLQHARDNPGSVSYFSPEIQNEFIHLLTLTVRNQLLSEIRKNKYYGILLDSTFDLGHREQFSQVIRFLDVDFQTKKVTIK